MYGKEDLWEMDNKEDLKEISIKEYIGKMDGEKDLEVMKIKSLNVMMEFLIIHILNKRRRITR